jgi:hypothetical protein
MSGESHKDIRAGRRFPGAAELEAGFPFYMDSIREDMSVWAESMSRRKPEEPDSSWTDPIYLSALQSLRDGAKDRLKTNEDLVGLVFQVMETLPIWALAEHHRCRVYLSRLRTQPLPRHDQRRRALGVLADVHAGKFADRHAAQADSLDQHPAFVTPQTNDHPERLRDVLAGKAWPDAVELLCGMPFFKGSLHEDMRHYAGRLLGGIEHDGYAPNDWGDLEAPITHHARRLQEAASNEGSTQWDLDPIVSRLMFVFPRTYHEGWLRCTYYRAALGVEWAKIDIASTAVSLAVASAEAGSPSETDYQLIAAALGWLACAAASRPALVGQPKPILCDGPAGTARRHGQTLIEFLYMRLRKADP